MRRTWPTVSAARDSDGFTYAYNQSGAAFVIDYLLAKAYPPPCIGFRLAYSAVFEGDTFGLVTVQHGQTAASASTNPQRFSRTTFDVKSTGGEVAELYAVSLPDARVAPQNNPEPDLVLPISVSINLFVKATALANAGDLKIYEFYPLVLDTVLLENTARSYLKEPSASPKQVTVLGYVPPDAEHTVTGFPGGDYTARVAGQTYEAGVTVIDFETYGDEAGRAYSADLSRRVNNASYEVKMGSRA